MKYQHICFYTTLVIEFVFHHSFSAFLGLEIIPCEQRHLSNNSSSKDACLTQASYWEHSSGQISHYNRRRAILIFVRSRQDWTPRCLITYNNNNQYKKRTRRTNHTGTSVSKSFLVELYLRLKESAKGILAGEWGVCSSMLTGVS